MRVVRKRSLLHVLTVFVLAGSCVVSQEPKSIVGSSPLYSLSSATGWLNSKPLTDKQLKGKVVLIDFWTYSCINCLRAVPLPFAPGPG